MDRLEELKRALEVAYQEGRQDDVLILAREIDRLEKGTEAGTYSPRTAAGQEMVQAVAEPLSQLPPVMAGPAAITRGAGAQARAAARRFPDEMARAAQAADEAATAATQSGIRVMTTDVFSPESFAAKWLQASGEKIPFAGTGGPRAAQQRERVSSVEDLMREYEAPEAVPVINRVAEDLIQTRSDKLTRFKNQKTQAINSVDRGRSTSDCSTDRLAQCLAEPKPKQH